MSPYIVVVDLDGTLISTNSFHKWMIYLFKKTLIYNLFDTVKILYIVFLRIFKIITHSQMKYKILSISESLRYSDIVDDFIEQLDTYINQEVLKFTKNTGQNQINILATAAPEIYAKRIASKYGFQYCISTPAISKNNWYENIRDRKRKTLKNLLNTLNLNYIDIVLSDHHDDIAIMKLAKKIYLVNATKRTKNFLKENQLSYFSIDTNNLKYHSRGGDAI